MSAAEVLCGVCGKPLPPASAKGGRPRIHCSRECGLVDHHMHAIEAAIGTVSMTQEARAAMRQRLWLMGNQIRIVQGRKPGTRYWSIRLACGHDVEVKGRSRQIGGKSCLDAPPAWTRCPECEETRRSVSTALMVAGRSLLTPRNQAI